jgi:predicted nucleotidyltransferase component of viral defense system
VKEYLKHLAAESDSTLKRTCLAREYLQARMLQSLQDNGVFLRWAFVGGTALRFLFSIPRFSEDLNFSLIGPGKKVEFESAMAEVKRAFSLEGYPVEIKTNEKKTVASGFVKFPGLPFDLGLSSQRAQTLSIKVEVDICPPEGAVIETSLVRRHATLNLCHYDKASLLAGKLHAIMSRPWAKGRDIYDLVWYLADRTWPEPNIEFLNSVLNQTGWKGPKISPSNWRREVGRRIAIVDWNKARADVAPFLERSLDLDLISAKTLKGLLKQQKPRRL